MNSSEAPLGPRVRNSLITTPAWMLALRHKALANPPSTAILADRRCLIEYFPGLTTRPFASVVHGTSRRPRREHQSGDKLRFSIGLFLSLRTSPRPVNAQPLAKSRQLFYLFF